MTLWVGSPKNHQISQLTTNIQMSYFFYSSAYVYWIFKYMCKERSREDTKDQNITGCRKACPIQQSLVWGQHILLQMNMGHQSFHNQ